jgi:hypothetical protein
MPDGLQVLQAPKKWAKPAAEQDQQDTATSAQAGSFLGQSQQARRTPSVQGKSKGTDGSKSHTLLTAPTAAAMTARRGSPSLLARA